MIMATGAIDAQPKHSRPDGANNVVEFVVAFFLDLVFGDLGGMDPGAQKSRRQKRIGVARESSSPAICQATNLS